jgi:hypothetical protein
MRILSLVFSFLVTVLLATLAYSYVSSQVGERRIVVQQAWLGSSEPQAYHAYGETDSVEPAQAAAVGDSVTGR